ncbi:MULTISPECIES: RHS repeat-associated core domain-containing protein [Rhodobacterales]|uniref:RHS repeat domain-containing protein n=2 Tax=Alphaproteobacteria TaxID=28211 RepID=UPI0032996D96
MKMDYDRTDVGTTAQGRETKYSFDLMDRLVGVTDPGGAQWTYTHDFKGNRLTADDPGLGFWTMEYDANDNLTKQYDAKGQTIEFTHDALDRVLSKTVAWTDGANATQTDVITYAYDEANPDLLGGNNIGQLTTLSGAHNTIRYGYDNAGNTVAEEHSVPLNGTTYEYNFTRDMHPSGALIAQTLPTSSNGDTFTTPDFKYDAAGRLTEFGTWLTGTTYDTRSNPTLKTFGNGMTEERMYDAQQGWIDEIRVLGTTGGTRELAKYWRSQAGRINRHRTWLVQDQYNYCYDYAGRLTVAADLISANKTCDTIGTWEGTELRDQFFTYRRDGSMASNSHVGDYIYSGSPVAHAPASVEGQALTYDANGNMTLGLNGKTMTYDGENRPPSVTLGVNTSGYVYGADGTRLTKLEQIGTQPQSTTLYVGGVEIRDPGVNEVVLAYPHENVRLKFANANSTPEVSYLFRDHLNSVRMIAGENQKIEERSTYKPFGEENESVLAASKAQETIGWIGERHDAGAGLQYLNARYYDPELGLFIQPDWFEVTQARVGTNRYSYSFNDPVNLMDPGGNDVTYGSDGSVTQHDVDSEGNRTAVSHSFGSHNGYMAAISEANNAGHATLSGYARGVHGYYGSTENGLAISDQSTMYFGAKAIQVLNNAMRACKGKCAKHLDRVLKPVDRLFKVTLRKASDRVIERTKTLFSSSQRAQNARDLANKAEHIFGRKNLDKHQMQGLLDAFRGDKTAAAKALMAAANRAVKTSSTAKMTKDGLYGAVVSVRGVQVQVSGRVIDGVTRLGTASMDMSRPLWK